MMNTGSDLMQVRGGRLRHRRIAAARPEMVHSSELRWDCATAACPALFRLYLRFIPACRTTRFLPPEVCRPAGDSPTCETEPLSRRGVKKPASVCRS